MITPLGSDATRPQTLGMLRSQRNRLPLARDPAIDRDRRLRQSRCLRIGGVFCLLLVSSFAASLFAAEPVVREGVHLRLTSDVDDANLLEDVVASFDAAVPQWLAFWGLPANAADHWKIDGYLMRDADAFRQRGVLPATLPAFENGFATPSTIWVHYQTTPYYNRHLILHEGVHSLAFTLFGGGGPSWYSEGTADLLATHRGGRGASLQGGPGLLAQAANSFRINELPQTPDDAPVWGRYRVIEERRESGELPTLASVLKLPTDLHGDVETYTWCWAAAMLLTSYDDTRPAFIEAAQNGGDTSPAFTTQFFREISGQWPAVRARWQVWLHDMEFGFDPQRDQVAISTDDPRYDGRNHSVDVAANRGWQSAGVWFPRGRLQLRARGECVIVAKENLHPSDEDAVVARDWVSTPAGITAHHHRGYPIGQLQICVLPIPPAASEKVAGLTIQAPFEHRITLAQLDASEPTPGVQTIEIDSPSWLLFRIHDVPGTTGRYQRDDNRDGYRVELAR
ncbi:hypothetical protein [Allorhodopirellula solitaria]|uniref:DUF1570 domain-containing protein n=1 Tax=Allorhodopirellula solitaria TaxID=2527987 RepID=A0A5C5YI16_9BACT|nr:hypothetical protein [Allorhodopirellula solitaria]TWT74002.1 hypothetical protein CA85_08860 [Allorhodopirellula solitaria]